MTRWTVVTGAQATKHAADTTTVPLRPITTPHGTRPTPAYSSRKRCPGCGAVLDGGPIRYRCAPCATGYSAADLVPAERRPAPRPADTTARTDLGEAA
ncbi:hypothetical protein [Actinomadura hibisca]|uniref:hypothetical protein n=1 Tax=Actinomadura hibisca TaxID=68565 RepID=UPI00082E6735|nr:hypothetical protein [Actinomadura hibisca]